MSAGIHVYVEYSFQSLCPGHGRTALIWRFVLSNSLSSALAPPGRCHQNPVLADWSEPDLTITPDLFDVGKAGKLKAKLYAQNIPYNEHIKRDPYSFLPAWLHPR